MNYGNYYTKVTSVKKLKEVCEIALEDFKNAKKNGTKKVEKDENDWCWGFEKYIVGNRFWCDFGSNEFASGGKGGFKDNIRENSLDYTIDGVHYRYHNGNGKKEIDLKKEEILKNLINELNKLFK